MSNPTFFELPQFAPILSFVDTIFAELNMGLFIYHAEDLQDPAKLRLIYANRQASVCTGTELANRVGKYIGEAFPPLAETEIPGTYLDVVNKKESQRVGEVEYNDAQMNHATYSVRAFPMPADCVGILFENLSAGRRPGEPRI